MAMVPQNMTPVYDGAGKLIGYTRSLPNVAYIVMENNAATFYSEDGSMIMRNPLTPELLQNLEYKVMDSYGTDGPNSYEYPSGDTSVPIIENPVIVTNTPIILDRTKIIQTDIGGEPTISSIRSSTSGTGGTGGTIGTNPPPWDPSKPCPTVLRLDYKINSDYAIDLSEIAKEVQDFISITGARPSETIENGRTVRKYIIDPCVFLRNAKIPSQAILDIYNSTTDKGGSTLRFEADINSSVTKNISIRDGLTDYNARPTYFDRLCDLMQKQSFSNGVKTTDMYVVFDYEYTDRAGIVHRVYFTARVYIDANGRCVCVKQTLENCDCKKYTLSLRNLRVVSEPGQGFDYSTTHDPSSPWYNRNLPADKQKVCFLKSDVWRCCINSAGEVIGSEKVGEILLGKSYQSTEWVDCIINGVAGKKIKVTQYFLMEDFKDGAFLQFRFDSVFKSRPRNVSFKFPTADLRGDEYYINQRNDLYWSDCDSSVKSTWGDYISQKLIGVTDGTIKEFIQYFADITSGTNRKVNNRPLWRPGGSIVQNGVLTSNPSELSLVLTCGSDEGDCIPEPVTPPPTAKEPTKYCVIVDSFQKANEIDSGQHVISDGPRKGEILPAYTGGRNTGGLWIAGGIRYGNVVYDGINPDGFNALTKFIEFSKTFVPGPTSTTRGNRVNLASEGLPCETGIFETTTSSNIEQYQKYRICYTISEETGKEGRLIDVQIQPGNAGTFNGNTIFSNGTPILDPNSREYDPNGGCCERLTWPDNWVRNKDYVVPGASIIQSLNMPPANTPYLDYDASSEELIMKDSCGCEMIPIADIWCYYNGSKKFKWRSKNVNDPTTHTGKPIAVPDERCIGDGAKVFHPFDIRKDISYSVRKDKTSGLFDGEQSLNCYLTSSFTSPNVKSFYYAVNDCLDCAKSPYFTVSYGNYKGSGSLTVNSDPNNTKTYSDAVYSQHQLLCNEASRSIDGILTLPKFTFVSESVQIESDDIYVVNFYRAGLSDKLDPGNFQINMSYLSGSFYSNSVHTGSNVKVGSGRIMQFIDNSDDFSQRYLCEDDVLTSYDIVSGSLENGKYQDASINSYGRVYPSLGVVVFHPKRLNEILGFNTVTGSNIAGDNAFKLFTSISGAAAPTTGRTELHPMLARNVNYKVTHHYSVRLYKGQSNYSNNPTYVTGSKNRIFDKCFINQPQTYVTSVGLYNENLELLAVAKLTRPLKKDFDSDLLIKIRLNW
jgi:hypothetical protein